MVNKTRSEAWASYLMPRLKKFMTIFVNNFAKFASHVNENIRSSGPKQR